MAATKTAAGAQIVLFEDHLLSDMNPITLTRPAFAVTCACCTLYDIAAAAAGAPPGGWCGTTWRSSPRSRYPSSPPGDGPKLFLNASIVPDVRYAAKFRELADAARPFVATAGGRVSAAFHPGRSSRAPSPLTAENVTPWLLELKLPLLEEELFRTFDHQFEVIKYLEPLFAANIMHRIHQGAYREVKPGVFAAERARIADSAAFHTASGPVVFERDVEVMDFTYFVGPVHVGARSRVIERASLKEHVCDRGDLQDRRRGGGKHHRELHQQAAPRVPGPFLRGLLGEPRGRHEQQRSEEHLRRGAPGVPAPARGYGDAVPRVHHR